jgi:hypothetical protein
MNVTVVDGWLASSPVKENDADRDPDGDAGPAVMPAVGATTSAGVTPADAADGGPAPMPLVAVTVNV